MRRIAFNDLRLGANRFARLPQIVRWAFFCLFLVQLTFVCARPFLHAARLAEARWPEGVLVVLAAAATLASLRSQLPGQNIMLTALIIAVIGGAVQTLGALTGIPFGPFSYTDRAGQQLFYPLPWTVPVLWIMAILSSRGVARLILKPWRKSPKYGLWLIGLTVLLAVLFDFALEPFVSLRHYWIWHPTKLPLNWYGAPLVNFIGWAVTALLILAFVTPALIDKRSVKHPPDYHPLVVWASLHLLFASGAALHQLWPATIVASAQGLLVAVFAIRGGQW